MRHNPIILALDVPIEKEALKFVKLLKKDVGAFKIGLQLFTALGPSIIKKVRRLGGEVFLDLKLHDIPNTVASACREAVKHRVKLLTIHTAGGEEMMREAAKATRIAARELGIPKPKLLGVTVLTSQGGNVRGEVLRRARLAKKSGIDGIVASAAELKPLRRALGKKFLIVTPGIRPAGADIGDQKRIATPKNALKWGATYLVIGRPILKSDDPLSVARSILR